MTEAELKGAVGILPDRLYWVALRAKPHEDTTAKAHFFTMDSELLYWNFFLDFGPLNLSQLYRFCQRLNSKLQAQALKDKAIYYYCGSHAHKRTNAAFLICAWSVLYLDRTPEEAFRPFRGIYPPFPPFHDASPCVCMFNLTILDCLRGLAKARYYKFFDFSRFNVEEYEHYEQVENGDLNWIIEGKMLAFAGPHAARELSPEGYYTLTPDDYVPYFLKHNVTNVVRLNKKYYDEQRFKDAGIGHTELYYLDGSIPTNRILQSFLHVCETTPGAVAVHCKAGLGRTGTCIGCYIMKHYRFTAAEAIGWIRISRPGSIIGPQQHYMKEMEQTLWHQGDLYRQQQQQQAAALRKSPLSSSTSSMMSLSSTTTTNTQSSPSTSGKKDSAYNGRLESKMGGEHMEPTGPTGAGGLTSIDRMSLEVPPPLASGGHTDQAHSHARGSAYGSGGGGSGARKNSSPELSSAKPGRAVSNVNNQSSPYLTSQLSSQGDSLLHRRAIHSLEQHRRTGPVNGHRK